MLAGDFNAKHVDWNSRLNRRRGKLLRDYADENSCMIFGPDAPTTNPYRFNATPDDLDIAISVPGVCDLVLCTKVRPPPGTH